MKLTSVVINGKIHRLSERALELLGLDKVAKPERPIALQKLPPNLEILKIQKKEPVKVTEPETKTITEPVEVKKKEDVIVESTKDTKKKTRGKVGVKK